MCISEDYIVHAGGIIENFTYTNSLEAICKNVQYHEIIELDVVKLKDGYAIAHDGMEKELYDSNLDFSEMRYGYYKHLKVKKKFTPLTFPLLKAFLRINPNTIFTLDNKFDILDHYINYLRTLLGSLIETNIIFHVHDSDDIEFIEKNNLKCIYALWKYNDSPYNWIIKQNLEYIVSENISIYAISLDYKTMKNFTTETDQLKQYNIKIFIYGFIQSDEIIEELIENNFGVFINDPRILKWKRSKNL